MNDFIILFIGNWNFIIFFFFAIFIWMKYARFDPYPYIFLNFIISLFAMFITLVLLIVNNHLHTKMDKLSNGIESREKIK